VKLSIFGGPLFFLLDERVELSKGGLCMVCLLLQESTAAVSNKARPLADCGGQPRNRKELRQVTYMISECLRQASVSDKRVSQQTLIHKM
jgi:hypothetical protein